MDSPVSVTSGGIAVGDLGKKNIIIGRPGTGKTTTLSSLINGYISEGNRSSGIVYLTYSRSMANQAKQKFGLDPKNGAMVGTFHSIGSKFLGWHPSQRGNEDDGDFPTERMLDEFCDRKGIQKVSPLKIDFDEDDGVDEFSQIMSAYNLSRNKMDDSKPPDYLDSIRFDPDFIVDELEKEKARLGKHGDRWAVGLIRYSIHTFLCQISLIQIFTYIIGHSSRIPMVRTPGWEKPLRAGQIGWNIGHN